MNGAFSTCLGPILVLWLGALVLDVLDRLLTPQDRGIAEASVVLLALASLVAAWRNIDTPLPLAPALSQTGWPGAAPYLIGDRTHWTLALILLGSALAGSVASLGEIRAGRSGRLAALGGTLLFCFAGDWATLGAAWVLVDASLLYAAVQGAPRETTGWTGALSLAGALALGAAIAMQQGRNVVTGSSLASSLAALAAVLRLMPYPLPSWQGAPAGDESSPDSTVEQVIGFAVPTALAAILWMRLGSWKAAAGAWTILLPAWATLSLFVAGARAWIARDPEELAAAAGPYGRSLLLLGAGLGMQPSWILALGAGIVLAVCAWFVSWPQCTRFQIADLHTIWRLAPSALALASLAGLLFTAGMAGHAGLYITLFEDERWLFLLLAMLGQSLFLGASLRVLFEMEMDDDPSLESAGATHALSGADGAAYGAALFIGAGLLAAGFLPAATSSAGLGYWLRLPTVPIWAAMFLPAVGAMALYRSQDAILGRTEAWQPMARRVLRLNWLFGQAEVLLRRLGSLIWDATQVIQGAGYMAWVVLVWLVLLLFILVR